MTDNKITSHYDYIKTVKNICPSCGTHAVYKHIYPDEGHMVCNVCRNKVIEFKEQEYKEKMAKDRRKYIRTCSDAELRELIIELFEV